MDGVKIYTSAGEVLLDVVVEDSSTQDWGIMSENQVSLDFYHDECVVLPASCYIEFDGQRLWLLDKYRPTENSSDDWHYQVKFLGAESLLSLTVVLNTNGAQEESIFPLTAPASQHLTFVVSNLNRRYPGLGWRVGVCPDTENIYIEYAGTYASDALQQVVGDKYEWWVDDYVVNIGRCEFGEVVELGYQNGLLGDISYALANDMHSYAYLYPIGSTKNIDPEKYGHARLQLPDGRTRIDIDPEQGLAELIEADAFAEIFPRYVGKVTSVRSEVRQNEDGTSFYVYYVQDSKIPFNPNDYEIAGEVKHITFQSGELMGADFEVNYDATAKEFEIITQWQNDGTTQLPSGALIPKVGDEYIPWNISMPDEYYPLAEQEYLEAAVSLAGEKKKGVGIYRAPVDFVDIKERGVKLRPGQRVRLLSEEYFAEGYRDSRITRITRNVCYPDEMTIEVSSVLSQGTISRLRTQISNSESQVKSINSSLKNFVDILGDQSVRGVKSFLNGFKIGDIVVRKSVDGTIYLGGNLVLKGGLAMYGDDGTAVPSIFDALPIDGVTIKRNASGQLYAVGGGGSGGGGGVDADIVNELIWAALSGYATQNWVEDKKYLTSITSSQVITALGYTPYNSANFTEANIKTTLGISDWALASVKPTYKYSEIGNTPDLSVYALNTDLAKKWTQNDAKIANWDSAYGWGNHAAAGYAKASDVTNEFKNYVKLAGDSQSITAQHNFTNGLKIGGISLRKVDNYLYLDSSLVLSGGFTMYGDDGTTVKPIWESIPFDRTTIDWVDGKWTVVGGVGSGGISEEFLNVKLQEYQPLLSTSNKLPYSLISGTPTIPTKLSQLTDDVVVGKYLPLSGGTVNGNLQIGDNANTAFKRLTFVRSGHALRINNTDEGAFFTFGDFSTAGAFTIERVLELGDSGLRYSPDASAYYQILHSGNYSDYALPKTGGTVNGSITATSFIGSLTGIANSATKLSKKVSLWGNEFDGTDNVSGVLTTSEDISFNTEKYNDVPWSRGFIWRNDNLEYGNMCYVNIRGLQYINIAHGAYDSILGLRILANGNVAIGGTTADAKLHVHGTARFTGDTTFSSKVIVGTIPVYESVDGTLYVDANVVFRGGVAMYGNTTTKVNEE